MVSRVRSTLALLNYTSSVTSRVEYSTTLATLLSSNRLSKFRADLFLMCRNMITPDGTTGYNLALSLLCVPFYGLNHRTVCGVNRTTFVGMWTRIGAVSAQTQPSTATADEVLNVLMYRTVD